MTGSRWLRRFHDGTEAGPQVLCLPHAGGSASFFSPLSALLSRSAEVFCAQYPGRQDRWGEPPVTDLAVMADTLTGEIRPRLRGPLTLFGHSMGAILAFEIALRLERAGAPPAHVVVSGQPAPSVWRRAGEFAGGRDDDASILAELRSLRGTDPRLLHDERLLQLVLPALRGDCAAVSAFRPDRDAVVAAPLTALTGDADPKTSVADARAWRRHTRGRFRARVFAGDHFYLGSVLPELAAVLDGTAADRAPAQTREPAQNEVVLP